MNNLNAAIKAKFSEWIDNTCLTKGSVEVDGSVALQAFVSFSDLPVTPTIFGRLMSSKFYKRQNSKTHKQCYFLNRGF